MSADLFKTCLRKFHSSSGVPLKIGIGAQHLDQRLEAGGTNRRERPVRHQTIDGITHICKFIAGDELRWIDFGRKVPGNLHRVRKRNRRFDFNTSEFWGLGADAITQCIGVR